MLHTHPRSKTASNTSAVPESETISIQSTGFNILQSIRDLTHQELNRANPLGLLGKEVISATGTTHCPEPIPPKETDEISINVLGQPDGVFSVPDKEYILVYLYYF